MTGREALIVNCLVFLVLIGFLFLGSGCTHVVHSDDPEFEYPVR